MNAEDQTPQLARSDKRVLSGRALFRAAQGSLLLLLVFLLGIRLWYLGGRGYAFVRDLHDVCTLFVDLRRGINPYFALNTGGQAYPVFVGYLAGPVCVANSLWPNSYWYIYSAATIASGIAVSVTLFEDKFLRVLAVVVFLTGFNALTALIDTGNIAIFELPLAAVVVIAHTRGRLRTAGIALGGMASIKLIPIVYSLAFLMPRIRFARRTEALLFALGTFALLESFSIALKPSLLPSFIAQLLGRVPGRGSPYAENFLGRYDQNFIDFFTAAMKQAGLDKLGLIAGILALIFFALGIFASWLARSEFEVRHSGVSVFGIIVLLLSLCLFRLKPYAYMALIPFAIASLANAGRWQQLCGLLIVGVGFDAWGLLGRTEYPQLLCLVSFLACATSVQIWNRVFPSSDKPSLAPGRTAQPPLVPTAIG